MHQRGIFQFAHFVRVHPDVTCDRDGYLGGPLGVARSSEAGNLRDLRQRSNGLSVGDPGVVVSNKGEVAESVREQSQRDSPPSHVGKRQAEQRTSRDQAHDDRPVLEGKQPEEPGG